MHSTAHLDCSLLDYKPGLGRLIRNPRLIDYDAREESTYERSIGPPRRFKINSNLRSDLAYKVLSRFCREKKWSLPVRLIGPRRPPNSPARSIIPSRLPTRSFLNIAIDHKLLVRYLSLSLSLWCNLLNWFSRNSSWRIDEILEGCKWLGIISGGNVFDHYLKSIDDHGFFFLDFW